MLKIILLIVLAQNTYAADWLCEHEASMRRGNDILSCGIGSGLSETEARIKAFDNAKIEFNQICEGSVDCDKKQIIITPQRTECFQYNRTSFQCYRLIVFTIVKEQKESEEIQNTGPISSHLKIKNGMTKTKVLAQLGIPGRVFDTNLGLEFQFSGKMCVNDGYCDVIFKDGKVSLTENFNPIYTDELN